MGRNATGKLFYGVVIDHAAVLARDAWAWRSACAIGTVAAVLLWSER